MYLMPMALPLVEFRRLRSPFTFSEVRDRGGGRPADAELSHLIDTLPFSFVNLLVPLEMSNPQSNFDSAGEEKQAVEARYAASASLNIAGAGAPGSYLNAPLPSYESTPRDLAAEWADASPQEALPSYPPQQYPPQEYPPQQNPLPGQFQGQFQGAPGTSMDMPNTVNLKLAVAQFGKLNRGYRLFQFLLACGALIAGIFSVMAMFQSTVAGVLGLWLYLVIVVCDVAFSGYFLSPRHTVISADPALKDETLRNLSKLVGYDAVMAAMWVMAAIFLPDCAKAGDWFCSTSDAAWWLGWLLVFTHGVGLILNVQNSKRIRIALSTMGNDGQIA